MHIAIVGCGLIGRKRAAALSADHQSELVIVADIDMQRAEQLAREHNCQATTDWEQVVNHPQVEAVVVATVNKFLAPITIAALERGKHVLVEKPMARNLTEAEAVLRTTRGQGDKGTGGQGDRENAPPPPLPPSPRLPVSPSPLLPLSPSWVSASTTAITRPSGKRTNYARRVPSVPSSSSAQSMATAAGPATTGSGARIPPWQGAANSSTRAYTS